MLNEFPSKSLSIRLILRIGKITEGNYFSVYDDDDFIKLLKVDIMTHLEVKNKSTMIKFLQWKIIISGIVVTNY